MMMSDGQRSRDVSAASRRILTLSCFAFLALATSMGAAGAEGLARAESDESRKPKTVRLLNVGNSFSGNATEYLKRLATAGGHVLIHRQAAMGGASLEQHWAKVEHYERDPADSRGVYANKRSLKQELLAEPWDFVTIQQASVLSHDLKTYQPYAEKLAGYIKQHARQAELLVHETWAYRRDDPRFATKVPKAGEPADQEAMYTGLKRAYQGVAADLGAGIIPVGDAFHRADTDPEWGYRPDEHFNVKTATRPALPDQAHSLHVGWHWLKDKGGADHLVIDGHHASIAGKYLGACVFYEVLYQETVVGNGFVPQRLDPKYARFLQETAHAAVADARVKVSRSTSGAAAAPR